MANALAIFNELLPTLKRYALTNPIPTEVGPAVPPPQARTVRSMGPADVVPPRSIPNSAAGVASRSVPLSAAESDAILGRGATADGTIRSALNRGMSALRGGIWPWAGYALAGAGYVARMAQQAKDGPLYGYNPDGSPYNPEPDAGADGFKFLSPYQKAIDNPASQGKGYPNSPVAAPAPATTTPTIITADAPVVTRKRGKRGTSKSNNATIVAPVTAANSGGLDPLGWYIRGASDRAGPMRDYSGPLITPAQLAPEELNAPESADLAFNRGIHTAAQAPQFGNDDLAVYDWQTGKPKLDAFGYQIRSADPRDHVGDPRWGANGQGLTPEQAEELDWYYRN